MKRALKIYLEKPELAGILLLVVLTAFFEVRSNGIFLSYQNIRGVLGLLPEVGAVTIGFAMLMICGDESVELTPEEEAAMGPDTEDPTTATQ